MSTRHYDVIVVGASFAGLAVARELRGEILLIDRHEVGSHQTLACGTPLWVPEALGLWTACSRCTAGGGACPLEDCQL